MENLTNGTCDKPKCSTKKCTGTKIKVVCEEIKIPVPWGNICGKWWGSQAKQPILAMHGWQDNAGTFDNLAPLLAQNDISVLSVDLPGHGFSSQFPPGMCYYIFWDGLVTVRRIVKHFKWSNVSIVGHSMGGIIGFMYASTFPTETVKLVSLDIASPAVRTIEAVCDSHAKIVDNFLKYESYTDKPMPAYDYDEMIDLVHNAYDGSMTRESSEIMMRRGMQPDGNGTYAFTRDIRLKVGGLGMIDIEQATEMASRITCEVLNIRGDPGMKLDNPEYYETILNILEKKASKFERHVIEGKHHLHLNNAESISDIIVKFLKA